MIAIRSSRRGATRLGVLAFASAAVAVIPTVAVAADGGTPTIRSTIGPDGVVKSTTEYTPDGTSRSYDGEQPISMQIGHTSSGASQTFSYHVENTFTETQSLNYFDTDGNTHRTSIQVQLPLVAQLGVNVPKAMGDVAAPGAVITTTADGTRHVLWNLVLFTPLGSPIQDVTMTTAAAGTPVAELRATPVDPASTPGLSGTSQAAAASYQQDDFWATYASGANGGLTLIKDGLSQLLAGIVEGADGAQQLADGSADAYAGSQELSDGLGLISAGSGDLTDGLGKIHTGQGDLTDGLELIKGGLDTLASDDGVPAAIAGVQQLKAGVELAIAGVGDDVTDKTLVNGIDQVSGGLALVIAGIQNELVPGLQCLAVVESGIVNGASAGAIAANPCYQVIDVSAFMVGGMLPGIALIDANFATNPLTPVLIGLTQVTSGFTAAAIAGIQDPDPTAGLLAALNAIKGGADAIRAGLSHVPDPNDPNDPGPGLRQGLELISAGLSHKKGLLGADDPGGLLQGLRAVLNQGIKPLAAGTGDALAGSQQLFDGSGEALDGSQQLTDGAGDAFDGSKELADGLGLIADGQQQVAAGLPAAVDGIGQLIDGVGQAQDDAVAPLMNQLKQDSLNSHKQLAVIQAAASYGAKGPGGPGATYVLTQSTRDFALAADTAGESHTGRNIGIGVGGAVLLLVGLGTGLAMGRRNSRVAA
jgi:putative membrane protein